MNQTLILTTGSQGESMSALSRIALGEHNRIQIQKGDTMFHFKHGEGTFKFFSPNGMAIVQFNNESFSRVVKKEELLENR